MDCRMPGSSELRTRVMIAARGRGEEWLGRIGRPWESMMACLLLEFSASHLMGLW